MNSLSVRPPATRLPPMNILIFAGLFWFFTYAALSVRTELILGDQVNLFTVRRILGTTVGALAFGLVLTCIARRARDGILNPASAIAAILPASLLVLAARLAIDELFYELPLPFETNFKWVAVWAGYFGMWVSASLAFQMHRHGERPQAACRPVASRAPAPAIPCSRDISHCPTEMAAWEWVADACAAELAAMPEARRHVLAERLVARAGYEQVESDYGSPAGEQAMRRAIALRIAARLSNR